MGRASRIEANKGTRMASGSVFQMCRVEAPGVRPCDDECV